VTFPSFGFRFPGRYPGSLRAQDGKTSRLLRRK
jgi:hypothetical protein